MMAGLGELKVSFDLNARGLEFNVLEPLDSATV